jgi:hypothetical protein
MVPEGGLEPPMSRDFKSQRYTNSLLWRELVRGAGIEPAESPASQAGGYACSPTLGLSNSLVGLVGFEPTRILVLNQVDLPVVHRPVQYSALFINNEHGSKLKVMAEGKGLEPLAVLPVTVFGTARPAYSPAFHRDLSNEDVVYPRCADKVIQL